MTGALLTNADFYGTLAAARSLGKHGVPVTVAHDGRLGAASWSRHVRSAVRCPSTTDSTAFLRWLLEAGTAAPGQVLYPSSDDTVFIYAAHRDQLSKCYELYQPPLDAVYALLNKRRLYEEGLAAGLRLPRTWFPAGPSELKQISSEARGPLMIKPVTQILFNSHRKGDLVPHVSQLEARYRSFADQRYGAELVAYDPQVVCPMIQEFHSHAGRAIYSLSGFLSREGDWAMRGAMKVLQLPRRLGVGICFESMPVEPRLAAGLIALCQRVGYFGVFEAEFICSGDDRLLIDFNPRFYGQMGFDLARDLPLARLAYEGALGHKAEVARLLREASSPPATQELNQVFCHRNALELLLQWQEAFGAMPADEALSWRTWLRDHRAVDAVIDPDDWAPAALDAFNRLSGYVRHPRAFVRSVVLDR